MKSLRQNDQKGNKKLDNLMRENREEFARVTASAPTLNQIVTFKHPRRSGCYLPKGPGQARGALRWLAGGTKDRQP